MVGHPEIELWVVDCERGPVRLGFAAPLAAALCASYHALDQVLAAPPA
jgi:Mg-chelatase subunit ChlD